MSNFSVIKEQDSEGFITKVKVNKKTQDEFFTCKECKKDFCLEGAYVDYLKSKINTYVKRTTCQKCKNVVRVSRGEAPILLRPDQEWPAGQPKPFVPVGSKTFFDEKKKPAYKHFFFDPVEETGVPSINDEESWPVLPKKEKIKQVSTRYEPGQSWADMEEEED